ncbi:MAG: TRAP transporter substrate-binding protein DctP [Deltaproteobacteria bacterium]|nr:TRAP transporter substrate-binding protein DctP [Deltaproteobacteria bacterium]
MKKLMMGMVSVFLIFSVSQGSAQPVKLKLSTVVPPSGPPVVNFLKPWVEIVKKESQGALEIEVYPGGVLGRNVKQYFEQVDAGVFDIAFIYPAYFGDRFPWADLFNVPFTAKTYHEAAVSAQRMLDRGLFKGLENYLVLTLFGTSPFYFFNTFPAKLPEDMKGHKGRSGSKFQSDLMTQLGMTPIAMEFTQTTESLSRGLIDSTIASPFVAKMTKANEVAKHALELPIGNFGMLLVMNKKKYQDLPPAAKATLDQRRGEWLAKYAAETMGPPDEKTMAEFKKDPNMTVYEPKGGDLGKWQGAVQPVIEKWKKASPENEKWLKVLYEELARIRSGK